MKRFQYSLASVLSYRQQQKDMIAGKLQQTRLQIKLLERELGEIDRCLRDGSPMDMPGRAVSARFLIEQEQYRA